MAYDPALVARSTCTCVPGPSALGGSTTTTSPTFKPLVTWTASGTSTPTITSRRSTLLFATTTYVCAFVGSDPSRKSAAGGTISPPGTSRTFTCARANSPETSSRLPGTRMMISNDRLRASTCGAMRFTSPWTEKPGSASTVTSTVSPTLTLPKSPDATEDRNSNTESSTIV